MTSLAEAAAVAPTTPGVYVFLGSAAELLYVGKAVNLRRRLQQHLRAGDIGEDRRAVLRRDAADVRWEAHADETAAADREADLIVALRPALNASYVQDGRWAFVVVEQIDDALRFRLLSRKVPTKGRIYGAFPHLGVGVTSPRGIACSEGYASLLRLLWAAGPTAGDRFPAAISGVSPPRDATIAVDAAHARGLHALLSGTGARVLEALARAAARREPYLQPGLRRDRAGAAAFFAHGPRALRALRLRHRVSARPLSEDDIVALVTADLRASIGPFTVVPRRETLRTAGGAATDAGDCDTDDE